MEALVGGLIVANIVQFCLLWHRLGKVEQRLTDIAPMVNNKTNPGKGG